MSEATIRLAVLDDVPELVEMRREFTFEDFERGEARPGYEEDCRSFLRDAITGGKWHIWVAEVGGRIVSHAFVALIDKVPRPIRENARIANPHERLYAAGLSRTRHRNADHPACAGSCSRGECRTDHRLAQRREPRLLPAGRLQAARRAARLDSR